MKRRQRKAPDTQRNPVEGITDWHHRLQKSFIVDNLRFTDSAEVTNKELREAYLEWIEHPGGNYPAKLIGDLHKTIIAMGAKKIRNRGKFTGVELRQD